MERILLSFDYEIRSSQHNYEILVDKVNVTYVSGVVLKRLNEGQQKTILNNEFKEIDAFEISVVPDIKTLGAFIFENKKIHIRGNNISDNAYRNFKISKMSNVSERKVYI